jgi:outer membrane protein OmpA-like peptidoglycan-associated protein
MIGFRGKTGVVSLARWKLEIKFTPRGNRGSHSSFSGILSIKKQFPRRLKLWYFTGSGLPKERKLETENSRNQSGGASMITRGFKGENLFLLVGILFVIAGIQGCVATRDWVRERLGPLTGRVETVESKVADVDGRVNQMGGQLSGVESDLKETKAKTYKALVTLANLKLERKLVLQLKKGATFRLNSAVLSDSTKREIDGFLSDLKSDLKGTDRTIFLVAGHTDTSGSPDFNYELGRKRADQVAKHLIIDKGIDPTKVMTVSYGESAPIFDNKTRRGREQNRRVEILVYSEAINSSSETSTAR